MEPATTSIVAIAVGALAEEIADNITEEVFGNPTTEALGVVEDALKKINKKLDHLLLLVNNIPNLVLENQRNHDLDEIYTFFDIAVDYAIANSSNGGAVVRSDLIVIEMLTKWNLIVKWESDPKDLMMLPYYTEAVRRITGFVADKQIADVLDIFIDRLTGVFDTTTSRLDFCFSEVHRRVTRDGVSGVPLGVNYKTSANYPYFSYDIGPHSPGLSVERRFRLRAKYRELRKDLKYYRKEITKAKDTLLAITPVKILLEEYYNKLTISEFNKNDTVNFNEIDEAFPLNTWL